jgi:hypothetical protein
MSSGRSGAFPLGPLLLECHDVGSLSKIPRGQGEVVFDQIVITAGELAVAAGYDEQVEADLIGSMFLEVTSSTGDVDPGISPVNVTAFDPTAFSTTKEGSQTRGASPRIHSVPVFPRHSRYWSTVLPGFPSLLR